MRQLYKMLPLLLCVLLLSGCGRLAAPMETVVPSASHLPAESAAPSPGPADIGPPAAELLPTTFQPEQGILYSSGPTRYDLTAGELAELWDMVTGLEPERLEAAPPDEALYRLRLCMGYFPGVPEDTALPEVFHLVRTNRGENGEQTTVGCWAELELYFLPGDVLRLAAGAYQCAPGSVAYDLLQRIADSQTPIVKAQADVDSALTAAADIIGSFDGAAVDAVWYEEGASTAAIRSRMHLSPWDSPSVPADNLIAVGFDMTRYGAVHRSRTLLLECSGPDAP